MKKILFLLLLSVSIYGQTNPTPFDKGIKLPNAVISTTDPFVSTMSTNGTISKINKTDLQDVISVASAVNLPVTGTEGKFYYVQDSKLYYTWNGTTYKESGSTTIDTNNEFTIKTGFSLATNVVTVNAANIWKLNGNSYTNPSAVNITIPYSTTGKQRIVYVVPNVSNDFSLISGTESVSNPTAPTITNPDMYVTFLLVTDGTVVTQVAPDYSSLYLKRYKTTYNTAQVDFNVNPSQDDYNVIYNNTATSNIWIHPDGYQGNTVKNGAIYPFKSQGTGNVIVNVDGVGVTLNAPNGTTLNKGQQCFLIKDDYNKWTLINPAPIVDISGKANIESPTFTGQVNGITKAMVGLPNVDNTTDANKPVSTATQTALDLKATDSDVVHKARTETITGTKIFGVISGNAIEVNSNINSKGIYATTTGGSNFYSINDGGDAGIISLNNGNGGVGVSCVDNSYNGGSAFQALCETDGTGYLAEIVGSGNAFVASMTGVASGKALQVKYNNAETASISKTGNVVANTYTGGATLTGIPTAPTATAGTNTTQIATTAFVHDSNLWVTGTYGIKTKDDSSPVTIGGEGLFSYSYDYGLGVKGKISSLQGFRSNKYGDINENIILSSDGNAGVTVGGATTKLKTEIDNRLSGGTIADITYAVAPNVISGGTFTIPVKINGEVANSAGEIIIPTAPLGTNTTQLATTAFVLANSGSGSGSQDLQSVLDSGSVANKSIILQNLPFQAVSTTDSTYGIYGAGGAVVRQEDGANLTLRGSYLGSDMGNNSGKITQLNLHRNASGTAAYSFDQNKIEGSYTLATTDDITASSVNTAFTTKTYAATMTVAHDALNPNWDVHLTGDLDLTLTGTVNGDSGLVNLYFTDGETAVLNDDSNFMFAITGTLAGEEADHKIPVYFVHDSDGLKWYKDEVGGSSAPDITKEGVANKSTNIVTDATSDTKYPSVKAVKNYVDSVAGGSITVNNIAPVDGNITIPTTQFHKISGTITGTISNTGASCVSSLPSMVQSRNIGSKIIKANGEEAFVTSVESLTEFTVSGFSTNSTDTAYEMFNKAIEVSPNGEIKFYDANEGVERLIMSADGGIQSNGFQMQRNGNTVKNGGGMNIYYSELRLDHSKIIHDTIPIYADSTTAYADTLLENGSEYFITGSDILHIKQP